MMVFHEITSIKLNINVFIEYLCYRIGLKMYPPLQGNSISSIIQCLIQCLIVKNMFHLNDKLDCLFVASGLT